MKCFDCGTETSMTRYRAMGSRDFCDWCFKRRDDQIRAVLDPKNKNQCDNCREYWDCVLRGFPVTAICRYCTCPEVDSKPTLKGKSHDPERTGSL